MSESKDIPSYKSTSQQPTVFPAYTQHTTDIRLIVALRPGLFGALDIEVEDASTKAIVFRGEGKKLDTWNRDVYDHTGHHLYHLKGVPGFGPITYNGTEPASGDVLFSVKGRIMAFKTVIDITFRDAHSGQSDTLILEHGATDTRNSAVTHHGVDVAHIHKKFLKPFSTTTRYELSINAGVDAALLVGICVCLDD